MYKDAVFEDFSFALKRESARLLALGLEREDPPAISAGTVADNLDYVYVQQESNYRFQIGVGVIRQKPIASVGAHITRPDDRNLSIRDYVRTHDLRMDEKSFALATDSPTFPNDLSALLAFVLDLLSSDLNPILQGTAWEVVPFDWQGYK